MFWGALSAVKGGAFLVLLYAYHVVFFPLAILVMTGSSLAALVGLLGFPYLPHWEIALSISFGVFLLQMAYHRLLMWLVPDWL